MPSRVRKAPPTLKVRRSRVHGRGVYAGELIRKGTRIIEYTGQRVPEREVVEDKNDPHTFYFGLDNGEVIDPEIGGNVARWINHSCDPNCESIDEDGRIFIYAVRKIEPGEELSYDYALQIDEPINRKSKKQYQCFCGSPDCRGTMLGL
jgi:SET domain-containing protein